MLYYKTGKTAKTSLKQAKTGNNQQTTNQQTSKTADQNRSKQQASPAKQSRERDGTNHSHINITIYLPCVVFQYGCNPRQY